MSHFDRLDPASLPKVLLHDHLDGGLRVETVLELADESGYRALPAGDAASLSAWFLQEDAADLIEYLESFKHTVAVLQTASALERVAYECGTDLAADGVVYAEVRFGPSLHLRGELKREDAIEAVVAGLARASAETGLVAGVIATAMRHETDSAEVARAAVQFVDRGVVGFDLAGPEAGFPPDAHIEACLLAREAGLGLTIHAGEHDVPASIWRAVARCAAMRIGHGARIIEDCVVEHGRIVALGGVARVVRDRRVPLEICITSNVHTGIAARPSAHPARMLIEAGFNVTFNTDNRLMSRTSATAEIRLAHEDLGLSASVIRDATLSALDAGFGDWPTRRRLARDVIEPAYASGAS